jgi:predicted dehydrogenase
MKFKIAVLGATGYIGSPYRREIRDCPEDATIVSLCSRRLELLEAAASEDGAECFTDDWRKAIAHEGVNLVLVCTPDALHHEAVIQCAERGLHVVCEKPIGMNATEASQMWSACRDRNVGHFVPLWTRYVDVFRRAKQIYAAGQLGQIRAFVYRWANPRPVGMPFTWRDDATISSAGSIADVGSHAYDAVRWILGDEAKRVLTHADVISPAKPDLGHINLAEAIASGSENRSSDPTQNRQGSAYDYASISIEMNSVLSTSHRLKFMPHFWTKADTFAARAPCTASSVNTMSRSDASTSSIAASISANAVSSSHDWPRSSWSMPSWISLRNFSRPINNRIPHPSPPILKTGHLP